MLIMFVPDNNFVTTPGMEVPKTTVPNMASTFVPNNNFVTTPGVELPKTTVPNMATMFVPNNNFVTTPVVELPKTTVPNLASMFVPNNNFVTTPGVEVPITTVPYMGTKFVPDINFVTTPGVDVPTTTVSNMATMFVPDNDFQTTSDAEVPKTTVPNVETLLVPDKNDLTTAEVEIPITTDADMATMFVPDDNVMTSPESEVPITTVNNMATLFVPEANFVTSRGIETFNTTPVDSDAARNGAATMAQTIPPPTDINAGLTEPTPTALETTPNFAIQTSPQSLEMIPQFQIAPTMFYITAPNVGIIPNFQPGVAMTEPPQPQIVTQSVQAVIAAIDFHTTQAVEIPEIVTISPSIEQAPVFVMATQHYQADELIPPADFQTTTEPVQQAPEMQHLTIPPMADLTLFDAQSMNLNSARQIEISENSSISENYPVTSPQQMPSTTPTSGLQHHQLGSLLETVLSNYYPQFRPRNDQSRFVAIFTDFVPISIIEFNTQEQKFSVMGYFKMDWRDDFLTWNPSDYEDTEILRIPVKSIWTPKLVINKAYDGDGLVGDRNTDIALINYRGYVRWFPEGIYSVVCKVSIQFYPFDKQSCVLTYFIADEDNSTINLKHVGDVDLTEYIENAEWKLTNLTVERKQTDNIYVVNYQFNVERRGGFAMFTLVVPILMLSVLSGTTFLIPIQSGEKCSFSVTVFLAYGIFETIVIDTLPHNSLDVSYFILYLTSLLIVSVLLTFYTIVQAKIFDSIGTRNFGAICKLGSSPESPICTWGGFLQKLDNYVFVTFLLVVVGLTSTFFSVMGEKFDFL